MALIDAINPLLSAGWGKGDAGWGMAEYESRGGYQAPLLASVPPALPARQCTA